MPNVIREDVVQVSFRSDGVQDILQGKTALKQLEEKAESASDAFASATKSSKKFGEESSESARKSKQSFEELGEEWDKSKETLAEWTERINTAGHRAENLQKMLGKDLFRNLDDDALLDIGESAEKSESAVDDLTESANVLADALSGAAAAFSVGVLLQNVSETQQALNKLQAQTGANASEMESMGEAVKTIYTSGIGESLGVVADTAALVNQQFQDLDTDTMQSITQNAMTMADTFGTDVNETLRGVNALMVNMGLSAEEAFDYIAKGTQNGLDKSGELSDNIAEYSQLWAQAGFSAEEMFTILQNGLDSGAYNLDKVNDFVKEFTISLSDGRMEENIENFSDRTQTLFAQWQNGTASQKEVFQSVINDLSTMTNQQEALTLASTVWSALGEDNAMQVITSLNNVNDTYNDVKGTMESINDIRYADIGTSFEQLKRSASGLLTETLTPAVTSLNGLLSTGLESLTAFASEHAALAHGMTVAATAAGVLTVGLIAVSGAIGVVKTALDALNVSSGGVLKIIGLVVTGVSALIGIFAGLHAAMADDEAEVEDYAGTLTECRTEIEQTELALKKAKERYGENSAVVKSLESDLELLNAQYEKGGGAVAEYAETATNAATKLDELAESERAAMEKLDATNTSGYVAISMLEALSDKANLTNADLNLMSTYANYLNDTFDCNIQVNYDTGELTGFDPQVISTQIASMYKEKKISIAMETISSVDFVDNYKAISGAYEEAAQEYQNALNEYQKDADDAYQEFIKSSDAYANESGSLSAMTAARQKWKDLQKPIDDAAESLNTCKAKLDDADVTLKENCDMIDASGELYEIMKENITETSDALSEYGDANEVLSETEQGVAAAQDAIDSYSGTLQELCIAYDEARTAALESIQSQFNLWDEVEAVA
ncbi:MAG: phage tail tape measure protein, partial [Ruminococcus sp.]